MKDRKAESKGRKCRNLGNKVKGYRESSFFVVNVISVSIILNFLSSSLSLTTLINHEKRHSCPNSTDLDCCYCRYWNWCYWTWYFSLLGDKEPKVQSVLSHTLKTLLFNITSRRGVVALRAKQRSIHATHVILKIGRPRHAKVWRRRQNFGYILISSS